jgi:hypothetical protein
VAITLGARIKSAGESMTGHEIELYACNSQADEMTPYERLLGDAMRGDATLFARQDSVEVAWRLSTGCSASGPQAEPYDSGSWGPAAAERMVERYGGWYDPPSTWARRLAVDRRRGRAERSGCRGGDRRARLQGGGHGAGRALVASGGETPWLMLSALRDLEVPWPAVHITQVDERVAPAAMRCATSRASRRSW